MKQLALAVLDTFETLEEANRQKFWLRFGIATNLVLVSSLLLFLAPVFRVASEIPEAYCNGAGHNLEVCRMAYPTDSDLLWEQVTANR